MNHQEEEKYVLEMNLGTFINGKFHWRKKVLKASKLCIFPKFNQHQLKGTITSIISPGKFYFQPQNGRINVEKHQSILAGRCKQVDSIEETVEGRRILVKHEDVMKRGKIVDESDDGNYKIFLIDYGKVTEQKLGNLFTCEGIDRNERQESLQLIFELPPQCFECRLSGIIPSPLLNTASWSSEATNHFKQLIQGKILTIEVESFVDDVASVHLLASEAEDGQNRPINTVNDHLVDSAQALTSDDSYMNQFDKLERERLSKLSYNRSEQVEDKFCDVGVIPPPENLLCECINLDGPYSPLECKPEMVCRVRNSAVCIDPSSVNQILIDPFPNDACKKVLVAASMSQKDDRVTIHQTTIMPHLPGLMSLLGLIFSPAAEIHLTAKKDRYSSILCGLGADKSQKPHFGEHDLLIKVDVEFSEDDFKAINELRGKISKLLRNVSGFKFQPKVNTVNRVQLRHEISQIMLEIFAKHRAPLGIIYPSNSEWNWKSSVKNKEAFESVYPRLSQVDKLVRVSESTRTKIIQRAEEINKLAKTNTKNELIKCHLCEEDIENLQELQLHVDKKLHKERLMRIRDSH